MEFLKEQCDDQKSGKTDEADQEYSEANCNCVGDGCDSVIHDLGQNADPVELDYYNTMADFQDHYEAQGKGFFVMHIFIVW